MPAPSRATPPTHTHPPHTPHTHTHTHTHAGSFQAYSTSETWYAVLDSGTNYCNLHNLATLSKLSDEKGFSEMTTDSMCTQYSSHNCDKYWEDDRRLWTLWIWTILTCVRRNYSYAVYFL